MIQGKSAGLKGGAWIAWWMVILVVACDGRPGAEVQALLDAGEDVALERGEVIELAEALQVRHEGQAIYTEGATSALDFATIRHGKGSTGTLIEGYGKAGLRIHDLILDGNRSAFEEASGILKMVPMLSLGGEGGKNQEVRRCIVLNSRSAGGWAAIHMQEGGEGIVVADNIVFSSGADVRGNGRSLWEKPFGWGDGISTASRNTLIRNNLIYDVSDEGVMVQGGPGSRVEDNVIVAVSREMLGGIALIDPFSYYRIGSEESKRFDYRDVLVEDNWIIAMGGRMHSGIPMGGDVWHPNLGGTILVGATVRNNLISGKAAGYGYVANGIDAFVIEGNRSEAVYSGIGDGLPGNPPDEPAAFLYNPEGIGNSQLQGEFQPARSHVVKVLRSDRVPSDPLGYRDAGYGEAEAEAIVEAAYVEMLGRMPSPSEKAHWTSWLHGTHANADTLRSFLMTEDEFTEHFGYVNPLALQKWRGDRWLELILANCATLQNENGGKWPDAKALHPALVRALLYNLNTE